MNTGKLIEEIVPWLVIAGMYLPYILKRLRKKRAGARPAAQPRRSPRPKQSERPKKSEWQPDSRWETLPEVPGNDSPAPKTQSLPDEGVRAVADTPPMQAVAMAPRATGRRRDLRRAYLLGEILQKKF